MFRGTTLLGQITCPTFMQTSYRTGAAFPVTGETRRGLGAKALGCAARRRAAPMLSAAVSHQTTALCIREREKGQIRFIAFVFLNIIMLRRGFVNGIIRFNRRVSCILDTHTQRSVNSPRPACRRSQAAGSFCQEPYRSGRCRTCRLFLQRCKKCFGHCRRTARRQRYRPAHFLL